MAMRDLVTGGAACAVSGSSSSSNPVGALTNAILGSVSKSQDLHKGCCLVSCIPLWTAVVLAFPFVQLPCQCLGCRKVTNSVYVIGAA